MIEDIMLLFFHGLMSSNVTNLKYKKIKYENKYCQTVSYFNKSFNDVDLLYDNLIINYQPKLIVGHSMGGYWAMRKSKEYDIPALILNPFITPNQKGFFKDYVNLDLHDFTKNMVFHLEYGDMLLDMKEVNYYAHCHKAQTFIYRGGSHFIKYVEEMNHNIKSIIGDR